MIANSEDTTGNPVENFLSSRKRVKYSVKTIARELGMKPRHVCKLLLNSPNIRKCDPIEVGSGKSQVNVFTWCESE